MITIQFELTTGMSIAVKEKSFASEAALERWIARMGDRVLVLRYEVAR